MKTYLLIILGGFVASCNQGGTSGQNINNTEIKTREEAILAVETYLKNQLPDARLTLSNDGLITISGGRTGYSVDPSRIIIGKIDDDGNKDAIIPVFVLRGQDLAGYEHLIMLQLDGKFVVVKTLNNVLKVIGIKDRIILAEVSTVPPDSPGFGCAECKEVVKYLYIKGEMVRSE